MVKESLTDSFDTAEGELAAGNVNTQPSGEQVAVNWHGVLTRMLSISPESAAGLCNAVGQASCLLSNTSPPEDSLREKFRMSVEDVTAIASLGPDNVNSQPHSDYSSRLNRTFG